jgi:hypothetical protein
MESIIISFDRNHNEAAKSRLAFLHSSNSYKRALLIRFVIVWLAILSLDLYLPHPFLGIEVSWDINTLSIVSRVIEVISAIVFCCFPAAFFVGLSIIAQDRDVQQPIHRLPAEAFGSMVITISPIGLGIKAPLIKTDYDWKSHLTLRITSNYLFISSADYLIVSIPISAFGSRLTEFMQKFQSWSTQSAKKDGEA